MQDFPTQFLIVTIASQRFGIRADDVQAIIRAVRLARLPKAPPIIEGVIDLRGTVVPVLDIRSRFRLPSKRLDPADHFIIRPSR
jgi:purine-binding chemotaxis protein CheW